MRLSSVAALRSVREQVAMNRNVIATTKKIFQMQSVDVLAIAIAATLAVLQTY
jgi:hypothetical protein